MLNLNNISNYYNPLFIKRQINLIDYPLYLISSKELSRIRKKCCPYKGCKEYTSVCKINYDGTLGEPIVGWPGNTFNCPNIWWDNEPWFWFTTVFLTSGAGSNQTYTSPIDWKNTNNIIEGLGAGASGGRARQNALNTNAAASGGGAGAYQKHINFTFAVPGTTQATYQIGLGGTGGTTSTPTTSAVAGTVGGDTWFNGATYGASTLGAKGGGAGNAANAGTVGASSGGLASGGRGNSTGFNGGGGGAVTAGGGSSGGGGAGGLNGAGASSSSSDSAVPTDGGQGDNGFGGLGGVNGRNANALAGDTGTEWDASHGSGGGGGAATGTTTTVTSGTGGSFGGGGGAGIAINLSGNPAVTTSSGEKGLIVLTYSAGNIFFSRAGVFH